MISDEVLKRAQNALAGQPTCLEFFDVILPMVKDFDFSDGKKLTIPAPTHYKYVQKNGGYGALSPQPYSHRVIRKVLSILNLKPRKLGKDKSTLTICSAKSPLK